MIFIFLSCHEKVHDNKEFSHEKSRPRHESWLEFLNKVAAPQTLQTKNNKNQVFSKLVVCQQETLLVFL